MKRLVWLLAVTSVLLAAVSAYADDAILAGVPVATLNLYERYKAEKKYSNEHLQLAAELAAAPGGDLCLLDAALKFQGEYRALTAREQLEKLNTQRTFDITMKLLDADDMTLKLVTADQSQVRVAAVRLVERFHWPETIPRLLALLSDDDVYVRTAAASVLGSFQDPRIEPALLQTRQDRVPMVAETALRALARLKSPAVFPLLVSRVEQSAEDVGTSTVDMAINDVAVYHNKTSVKVLLTGFKRFEGKEDVRSLVLRNETHARLIDCLREAQPALGPLPDENLDEWQDYWQRAEPLLTDDLRLQVPAPPRPPEHYQPEQFAKNADAVTFTATVDAATYRVGDPIQLQLTLTNHGAKPVAVVMPRLPSGWWPTMAYGIRLQRGNTVLFDLAPSDFYEGSYSGPPNFETLAPGASFHSTICLQHWLDYRLDMPLPEGDYQLTLTFDSSKFAGIRASGVQLLHRWTAPPVSFSVRGEARTDPDDLLAMVATKTGIKFLREDLISSNLQRYEPAWRTVLQYGDSRLAPLVNKIEAELRLQHRNQSYINGLRPYERKGLK